MITTPIVLILGAGASAPYGFPIGDRLRKLILANLTHTSRKIIQPIVELGFTAQEIDTFRQAFDKSQQPSIDAFLEHRSDDYMEIGKLAIAATLIPFEREHLLLDQSSNDANHVFLGDPWYQYLIERLTTKDPDHFRNHKLSIITFNYDRSLEYSLALVKKQDPSCDTTYSTQIFILQVFTRPIQTRINPLTRFGVSALPLRRSVHRSPSP